MPFPFAQMLRTLALSLLAATAAAAPTLVSIGQLSATLDFNYGLFSNKKAIFGSAFARAVAKTVGINAENVQVLSSQMGPTGVAQTVLFYTIVAPPNSLTLQTTNNVLFGAGAVVGAAGTASFTANIASLGLTLTPTVHLGNSLPAPPPPLATFTTVSQGTQIAFAKPFADWQYGAYAYNAAVQSAIAEAVGCDVQDVWIYQNSLATGGGTIITFDITAANAVSDTANTFPVAHNTVLFASLFNHTCLDPAGENNINFNGLAGCLCNNNSPDAVAADFNGCGGQPPKAVAPYAVGQTYNDGFLTATFDRAGPKLLGLLKKYGLTFANEAFFFDQVRFGLVLPCLCVTDVSSPA